MSLGLALLNADRLDHGRPLPEALALRYQVYCEEFDYLPASDYPTGLESDEDDAAAAHIHVFEPRPSAGEELLAAELHAGARKALAGYVRLVRPDAGGLLPVQRRCHLTLNTAALHHPHACAEVSRLIIAPAFRRQRYEGSAARKAAPACSQRGPGGPLSTDVLLDLFRQMLHYSRSQGIRYWFAAMERPLARSLAQMGFPFQAAGPEGEFFGRITPHVADLHDLQHRVAARQPRLAQWLLPPPRAATVSDLGDTATLQDPNWAHRPPPPQLWRADC